MIAIAGVLFRAATGSPIGLALSIAMAASVTLWGYAKYHQQIGGKKAVTKIVNASNKKGKERVRKINKIRRNIKPDTAWSRLQSEYASPD